MLHKIIRKIFEPSTNHFECGRLVSGDGVRVCKRRDGGLVWIHRPVKRVLGTGHSEAVQQ